MREAEVGERIEALNHWGMDIDKGTRGTVIAGPYAISRHVQWDAPNAEVPGSETKLRTRGRYRILNLIEALAEAAE